MISRTLLLFTALLLALGTSTTAFAPQHPALVVRSALSTSQLGVFGKKKPKEDLSDIETRDMTRDEMLALNAENEKIMNAELVGMTGFSLVISIPLFYLVWVAFFSDTAGDLDISDVVM
jgi:hypothetical protein